jgi:hypothetical protein
MVIFSYEFDRASVDTAAAIDLFCRKFEGVVCRDTVACRRAGDTKAPILIGSVE